MAGKNGLTFVEKKKILSKELVREILITVFYCFAAVLLATVLVIAFGYKSTSIGASMRPELENGQEVLVDRFVFKLLTPKRFDVVCFYPKGNTNSHIYIKRVIGLPGETVEIKDGYVYINGVRLLEDESYDKIEDAGIAESEFKLNDKEYFVLGDNRNNSEDSRMGNIGAVHADTMIGRAWFKFSTDENGFGFIK